MGTNGPDVFHAPIDAVVIDQRQSGWWGDNPGPKPDGGSGITRLRAKNSVGICKAGTIIGFGHCGNASVHVGQSVSAGESLGHVGFANAWHIHFFIGPPGSDARDGIVNPQPYIDLFQKGK